MANVRAPGLGGVLFRVALVTFLLTLLTFALTLLGSIVGMVIAGELNGGLSHVNLTTAYRDIALPAAITVGGVVLVGLFVYEIRRYLQVRALSRLEEKF
jgi:hypothetical protein